MSSPAANGDNVINSGEDIYCKFEFKSNHLTNAVHSLLLLTHWCWSL
jgi:hypothetical protein